MGRKNKGNSSSIGTASHLEIYRKCPLKKGESNKRNRKDCEFFDIHTRFCFKLKITCVGFSNTLCPLHLSDNKKINKPKVGTKVWSVQRGVGTVKTISSELCTIQFEDTKVQCRYKWLIDGTIKIIEY